MIKIIIVVSVIFIATALATHAGNLTGPDIAAEDEHKYDFLKGEKFIFDEWPGRTDKFGGWTTEYGINLVLNRIKYAGFNVLVPCIWHGDGARYAASDNITREKGYEKWMRGQRSDTFQLLISEAHSRNLKIYPWFCVNLRDQALNHLQEYYDKNKTPDRAFDIHRPQFRKYIIDVMLDIVRNYDIDGFVLDMIRTQGICTCSYCSEEYKKKYGSDISSDAKIVKVNLPANQRLSAWQKDAVSELVAEFAQKAKALKPTLKISACGHPRFELNSLYFEGRDIVDWFNKGLLDFIFSMDYEKKLNHNVYAKVVSKLKDQRGLVIIVGNYDLRDPNYKGDYRNNIFSRDPTLVDQLLLESLSKYESKAVGLYWYYNLSNEQIDVIRNSSLK